MAKGLSKYVFIRVRGRIVPIRKTLERASRSENNLIDKVLRMKDQTKLSAKKVGLEKVGSGVDFSVFKQKGKTDNVLKILKKWAGKTTKGTSSKYFSEKWPELSDKLALNRTLSENLPNYGIPTEQLQLVRIKRKKRGLIQNYVSGKKGSNWIRRESERIKRDSGLDIDAHFGNIVNEKLIDTGGNLMRSDIKKFDRTAEELVGIDNYYGANIKDYYKKSDIISDEAILSGISPKIRREIKGLRKKGYRLSKTGKEEYAFKKLKKVKVNIRENK